MAYKALYRTYRPQQFSDVLGQEVIVKTLQSALANRKISHAYLFSGPRGTGKTSVARIFAKALNCAEFPTIDPCGECQSCMEIAESNSPDVIEIDAASNNGVDEIRDIRDKVKFLPAGAHHKIYIIDEVHMLSSGAFNALLKTLEEPPKHVIFILATTEPHKVLPTILSRCQRFDFKSLTIKEITARLSVVAEQERMTISQEAMVSIAESAEGGLRDALSFLDQASSFADDEITVDDVNNVTGNLSYNKLIELVQYFEEKEIEKALKAVNELINLGKEVTRVVSGLLQFFRDVLLYKNVDTTTYSKYIFEKEGFRILASGLTPEKVFYYVDILSDVQSKIRYSNTPHIFLEVALIKMINMSQEQLDFVKRIRELEEKIEQLPTKTEGVSQSGADQEKVDLLENTIQRVISQLSKMEIPKWIEKIQSLEQRLESSPAAVSSNPDQTKQWTDITREMDKMNNKFTQVIDLYNRLMQQDDLEMKIQHLESMVEELEETVKKTSQEPSKIESQDIDTEALEEKLQSLWKMELSDTVDKIQKTIDKAKSAIPPTNGNSSHDAMSEISDIKEKIEHMEEQIYRLLSSALSSQNLSSIKKSKSKVNQGQIVFVGDEILPIAELEKGNNGDTPPLEQQHLTLKVEKTEIEEPDSSIEQQKIEVEQTEEEELVRQEEVLEDRKQQEEVEVKQQEPQVIEPKTLDQEVDEIFKQKESKQSVVTQTIKPNIEAPKPQDIAKVFELNGEKVVDKRNSQLVTKTNKTQEEYVPARGIFALEKEEKPVVKEIVKEKQVENPNEEVEFCSFDVKIIERILHDSRSPIARNDKARIANLWLELSNYVDADKMSYAEVLKKATIAAVGEKEFIIVFKSSVFCNEVMSPSFKREARKILYDHLGDAYNYMALPENVWMEKRTEYVNQYNIGIQKPRLTPIQDPTLHVVMKNAEEVRLSDKERMIQTAYELFGKDIVKVE